MRKKELIEINGILYKECPHCNRLLSIDSYSKSNTSTSGYRSWCKDCVNNSINSEENKRRCRHYYETKGRELARSYKESDIRAYLFNSAKSRAKQRHIEFSINIDDIVVPEKCPILNIPLKYNRDIKKDDSYSLDRIDSSKGYIKGNIWVISLRANRIKNDSTPQELRLIADKVEEAIKTQFLSLSTME